ncbi:hypothetical protein [Microbulbifer sp. PSTR4-B]|uniref:hypothetical protein n=1 Tax=unclassified Microbulbifer TaxID=2619833 RepID=UPI00403A97FE
MIKPRAAAEWQTRHVFILARGHREAANYAKAQGLHPLNWEYLNSCKQLKKKPGAAVVTVGNFHQRKDIAALTEAMKKHHCHAVFAVRRAG